MISDDHVIAWKTNAWKDPGMVAAYGRNVAGGDSANLIKNAVETSIIAEHVTGSDILDVGVGTGRASIPLASRGYHVTGVDSSQAMLDAARSAAGAVPVELMLGDVAALPFADESFDSVIALNTAAHFPHWRKILSEWTRVVRPNGRLVYDMYSLDHDRAYAAAIGRDADDARAMFAPKAAEEFMLRLSVRELVPALDDLGLTVSAIVPYGLMFGLTAKNRFLADTHASGHAWARVLSYAMVNPVFLDFCVFVEQEIVGRLTSSVTNRYMIVLERRTGPSANAAWLERNDRFERSLRQGCSASTLADYGIEAASWRSGLTRFLEDETSRMALVRLLSFTLRWTYAIDIAEFLPVTVYAEVKQFLDSMALDNAVTQALLSWHAAPDVATVLTHRGVELGPTLAYSLVRRLLEEGFGVFDAEAHAP